MIAVCAAAIAIAPTLKPMRVANFLQTVDSCQEPECFYGLHDQFVIAPVRFLNMHATS